MFLAAWFGGVWVLLIAVFIGFIFDFSAPVENLLSPGVLTVPGLDVVVEDFNLRGKSLGRLELDAALPLSVMSLLRDPEGYLTNLSSGGEGSATQLDP